MIITFDGEAHLRPLMFRNPHHILLVLRSCLPEIGHFAVHYWNYFRVRRLGSVPLLVGRSLRPRYFVPACYEIRTVVGKSMKGDSRKEMSYLKEKKNISRRGIAEFDLLTSKHKISLIIWVHTVRHTFLFFSNFTQWHVLCANAKQIFHKGNNSNTCPGHIGVDAIAGKFHLYIVNSSI